MKPLNYSQYRIQQALWLQSSDAVRTNRSMSSERYFLTCYIEYLSICGIDLAALGYKGSEYAFFKNKERNRMFKNWVQGNVISIVDRLVKNHLGI